MIALIAICVAGTWIAVSNYQQKDVQLSYAPKRFVKAREFIAKPSSLSVNIRLPFDELSAKANQSAPNDYRGKGTGNRKCKRILGIKTCGTPQYDYVVSRGDIDISAGPANNIRLSVPLTVTGNGGYQGKAAKLFGLQSKQFRASLRAISDISLEVARDWCPKPSIRADFEWIEGAKIELFNGVWVSVRSMVEPKLRERIAQLSESVTSQIDCRQIQGKLRQVWASHTSPISVGDAKEPLHLNISPRNIGFSGLHVDAKAVNLAVHLLADASVSATPAKTGPLALPALQKTSNTSNSALSVSLPMFVPYSHIQELLANRLMRQPLSADTPAGVARIETRELNVYPSGNQLVVAALLNIDLPTRLLDVNGWVYLTTSPAAISEGTALKLSQPAFSRDVDNQLWRVVSAMLHSTVKQGIQDWGVIDLTDTINKSKRRLAEQVAKPRQGFRVEIGNPEIRLGEIAVTADQLVIEAIFRSRADIALSGL